MTTTEIRCVLQGLDTLQIAYYLEARPGGGFPYESLLVTKERLRANRQRQGATVELNGWEFSLRPYGSSSGYPLVLENRDYTLEFGEFNNPSFFVTFRSEALWRAGAEALHREFEAWAVGAGLRFVQAESVSRVDFAFDYLLPSVDFNVESVVSKSAKDSTHRQDGGLQTLTFGRGDIVLRIYDKVAEIEQQSAKVWLFDLWGVREKVWRIEWQARKAILRRFGIRTLQDLFDSQGDVLRYLVTEHDSLRLPAGVGNRSRWPLHPLWVDLREQIEGFQSQGVRREINDAATLDARELRIAISLYVTPSAPRRFARCGRVRTPYHSSVPGPANDY